jgi:hypothetical protein
MAAATATAVLPRSFPKNDLNHPGSLAITLAVKNLLWASFAAHWQGLINSLFLEYLHF